jgi:RNA 2',3'-cyclic 3'-phosphodiesterase
MVRLFAALELPDDVRAELSERLRVIRAGSTELRWTPPDRWHITLAFYGDREHAGRRGTWFRERAAGLDSVRLRLRGAGRFPGVLWVGVSPVRGRDATALRAMAGALNADGGASESDRTAHLTIARWRRGAPGSRGAIKAVRDLSDYRGHWWTATEVVLFRSDTVTDDTGTTGPVYTALDRVALAGEQG